MNRSETTESVLKRYFPVILKPIVLTLLFFVTIVWLYSALSTVLPPQWVINPDFTPDVRAEEIARVSNLGSFLTNLFQGNFGYSFRTLMPVWDELVWRFPTTLILVGLPTIFSILIGVGLSLLFKPGRQKPSTFAHSLKGFFFGLAPFLGLAFLLFFCYYPYVWWGSVLFPSRGLSSVPPPTDPLAYVSDMLWHLSLPVAALTLIGVVRILLVIWSSGSTFTGRALLKKALLPFTTIDFAFTISAVIIVEWLWTLPGLGRLLLDSLFSADFNALVGAFVMLLVLAVGLGYVSVLLDFVQRLVSLHEDLEKKITIEPKINPSQTEGGIKRYVKLFLKRRSLMIGSAIVIVLLVLAAFAPFITPYDPMAREPVAQEFAMPQWMTIFPQYSNLSATQENHLYWNAEEGSEFVKSYGTIVTLQYEARDMETADVELSANFSHMAIPPNQFYCRFNWTTRNVQDVAYSLRLILSTPDGEDYELWVQPPLSESRDQTVSLDSVDPFLRYRLGFELFENPAPIIFSQSGEYVALLQIQFRPTSDSAKCDVSLQDADFVILGQVHGILGTDNFGADVFAQLVYGARTTIALAFLFAFLAVILGFPPGFISGYFQSWADSIVTPIIETLLFLPILPILLVVVALFGRSWIDFLPISLLFLFVQSTMAFRNKFLLRPSNQKLKGTTTVTRVLIVFKDLCANFCFTVIGAMLLLTSLGFLGFGDPTMPSLGNMIYRAFAFGAFTKLAWWWILPPVIYIGLFALGLLLLGVGLEDEGL